MSSPLSQRWLAVIWAVCFGLGLVYLVLDPPYQAPDEPNHFLRAWTVSQGNLVAAIGGSDGRQPGGFIPNRFAQMEWLVCGDIRGQADRRQDRGALAKAWVLPLEPARFHFARLPNTGGYSPLCYTGAALALRLLSCFEVSPLALFYGARLGNLLVWSLLVTTALWIVPTARWTLALLALTPMALNQAGSASADGWNHALALLTLAAFTRFALQDGPLSRRERSAALGLLILVGFTRQVFVPLALLAWMVPRTRFGGLGRWLGFILACGLAAALPAMLWTHLTRPHIVTMRPEAVPADQLAFAAAHPGVVLQQFLATLRQGGHWLTEFIGNLGWLDTGLPPALISSYWLALIVSLCLTVPGTPSLSWAQRPPALLAFASSFLLVMFGLYVVWTPRGNATVEGIQGRYLTPLAPMLAVVLAVPILRIPERVLAGTTLLVAVGLNVWAATVLRARFWGPW